MLMLGTRLAAAEDPSKAVETAPAAASILGKEQLQAEQTALMGVWVSRIGQVRRTIRFGEDGRFESDGEQGEYRIEGTTVLLRVGENQVAYEFTLDDGKLVLSGGDLARPLDFAKVRRFGASGEWLFDWSPSVVKARLRRIGVVILIVLLVQVILWALRALAHFVIYSERGPLRFIYRRHKSRTMTIYSLVLNLAKYLLYLFAIGLILTQLGIDYTVYLASLSVIGLAIGFGSQGLVQDMVTGFFIVFEEQFNVGDMVEIPPHVGVVEELGLRMTRLRNYTGQRVTIPNRNIGAVGNYLRGAQQVYIDVAVTAGIDAAKPAETLRQVAEEVGRQFHDVILAAPESRGELALSTGERFVRLYLAIWPQQQWIIEQELLPRIRAAMKHEGMEIANDKISVFYHPRETQAVHPRRRREDVAAGA